MSYLLRMRTRSKSHINIMDILSESYIIVNINAVVILVAEAVPNYLYCLSITSNRKKRQTNKSSFFLNVISPWPTSKSHKARGHCSKKYNSEENPYFPETRQQQTATHRSNLQPVAVAQCTSTDTLRLEKDHIVWQMAA